VLPEIVSDVLLTSGGARTPRDCIWGKSGFVAMSSQEAKSSQVESELNGRALLCARTAVSPSVRPQDTEKVVHQHRVRSPFCTRFKRPHGVPQRGWACESRWCTAHTGGAAPSNFSQKPRLGGPSSLLSALMAFLAP